MGLYKQLLLGTAAVLTAAAGAQAADLPSKKAAPVQYVKICDVYGAGFFYIPGSDTCLRVGGYVRAEYMYSPASAVRQGVGGSTTSVGAITQVGADQDTTGMEIRGRVDLDARTQTSYGTVRSVVNLRGTNADGLRNQTSITNGLTQYVPGGNKASALTMERAYIQFAGFTAGVAPENFSPLPSYVYSGDVHPGFPNGMKQLAYTATFGGGLSATIAIEDATGDPSYETSGGNYFPSSFYASTFNDGYLLVGNVRDDQSWGYVQLSGAVQNDSIPGPYNSSGAYTGLYGTSSSTSSWTNNPLAGPSQSTGYAVGIGGRIYLPMIAPGDEFNFQAQYADGLDGLLLSSGGLNNLSDSTNARFLGGIQRKDTNVFPTMVNTSGIVNGYGLETGFSIEGLYTHYWAPQWRSNFIVGYAELNPPSVQAASTGPLVNNWGQGTVFVALADIIWSPVKNFDIGLEAEYLSIRSKIQNPSSAFVSAGMPGLSEDGVNAHLRLERTF